jgi:uncharacterized protein YjbI with pentapeptide repeats
LKPEVRKRGKIAPAELRLLTIERETRTNENFSNLKLDGLTVIESSLRGCTFEDVRARSSYLGSGLRQSMFEDCVFRRCTFTFGAVGNARLVGCRFESCRLENMFGTELELIECTFQDTTIRGSVFHGEIGDSAHLRPRRTRNEIRDNDFSGAELENVDFRGGIDLTRQKLPTGENYLFIGDTCQASRIVRQMQSSLLETQDLQRSQTLASLLDFYCSTGQRMQLLRVPTWGCFEQELRSRLSG